ncbi:MAG: hypothetical protein RL160_1984 [Bacteroidota bacterium]|jgi:hypothetical protein
MKSTAVKIKAILFLLFVSSCAPQITGTWNYLAVYDRNSGKQVPVSDGDSMIISKDGRFAYLLKKANRSGNGFWKLNHADTSSYLVLRYLPNNHERSFRLDTFTRKKLVMSEGTMVFSYRR